MHQQAEHCLDHSAVVIGNRAASRLRHPCDPVAMDRSSANAKDVVGGGGPDRRGLFRCEFGAGRLLSLKNQLGDLKRVVVIRRRNRGPHIDALLISVEDTLRTDLINKPPSVPVWRQARAMRLEER